MKQLTRGEFKRQAAAIFRRVAGKYYGRVSAMTNTGFQLTFNNQFEEVMFDRNSFGVRMSKIWDDKLRQMKRELKLIGKGVPHRVVDERYDRSFFVYFN